MNTVIFGDVHGEANKLLWLIRVTRTQFGKDIRLISLGDLVDRGPDSRGVLDACVEEGVEGILGNHDLWLCSVLSGHPMDDTPYSKMMGGLTTLRSYGLSRGDPDHVGAALRAAVPQAHKSWLLQLPPFRFVEVAGVSYMLVHAGIPERVLAKLTEAFPNCHERDVPSILCRHSPDAFFWTGPDPMNPNSVARFRAHVQVFGHRPVPVPILVPGHFAALDTGCGTCHPYALSALVLLDDGRVETFTSQ